MRINDIIKQFRLIASTLGRIPQPRDCSKMSGADFRALTDINTAKAKTVSMAEYLTEYGVADAVPTDKVLEMSNETATTQPSNRVDYETARALKLMGFPQYHIDPDKPRVHRLRINEPHYVTIYNQNMIHEYVDAIHIGHVHGHDVMCYAPTRKEAAEFLLNIINEKTN